ncbi:hypothetical protein ACFV2H_29310 [Streptomyces sp. NPDC059629]|uniref:hypothetical protein n=1 Tax=Streptomyces sp. NPDC059629 TaxID=3346889 RepID=UPI003685F111
MSFAEFIQTTKAIIDKHFAAVDRLIASGQMKASDGGIFLFPSTVLYTETKTHYSFELIGAMRKRQGFHIKERRTDSLNQVVNNFTPTADTLYIMGTPNGETSNMLAWYRDMNLMCEHHKGGLEKRFPGVQAFTAQSTLIGVSDRASHLAINAECLKAAAFENCMLASRSGGLARPKLINFMYTSSIEQDSTEVTSDLARIAPVKGVRVVGVQAASSGHAAAVRAAAGFATLYLQGAGETTITTLLEKHSDMIEKVFDADLVFYQPVLPWKEGNPDPDEVSIQPDVLLRTKSGDWKIIDFKLPLLDKKSLTAKGHKRRRLIFSVDDGVRQLANYEEYFTFPGNLAAVQKELGVLPGIPQLALVVGSDENFDGEEVRQAKRLMRPFDIIDYDSFIRMYLDAHI